MPYETPNMPTGQPNKDIRELWEWAFKLVEQLNLAEDAQRTKEGRNGSTQT